MLVVVFVQFLFVSGNIEIKMLPCLKAIHYHKKKTKCFRKSSPVSGKNCKQFNI